MLSSTRGNSFGISKKILCVIMAISLSLMMLPSALFRTEAQAASPTNDDVFVKADNDMTNFGQFAFNPNSNAANISTYTQNDLLYVIGCKAETEASVSEMAFAQIKKSLTDDLHSVVDDILPAAKDGAICTLSSIDNIVSDLSCLSAVRVADTTSWKFLTTDPVSDSKSGKLIISAKYAHYFGQFEVALNGELLNGSKEIIVDAKSYSSGKIIIIPTVNKNEKGDYVYNVVADLDLINVPKQIIEYPFSVHKDNNAKPINNPTEGNPNAEEVDVDLSTILTDIQMKTFDDQNAALIELLNSQTVQVGDIASPTTLYLHFDGTASDMILNNNDYKLKFDEDIANLSLINTDKFVFLDAPDGDPVDDYTPNFINNSFKVNKPAVLDVKWDDEHLDCPVIFKDGGSSERVDPTNYTFKTNKNNKKISVSVNSSTVCNYSEEVADITESICNPVPTTTLSSDNVEVKVYAKNSESKIVSVVNTTIIYADPDITYLGYDITKQGDPGTDYEEGTIEDNFFAKIAANIINEANKFFFAKQTVEISLKFGTKNDINKVELYNVKEEAISSTEYSTKDQLRYFKFTLDLGIDEEFSVDMNDVDVIAYGPGRIISSLPKYIGPAVVPNEDSATMIVANGPAPSTINVLWDEGGEPTDTTHDFTTSKTFTIQVAMPSGAEDLFKYTIADKSDVIVATLKTDGVNEKNYYYGDNGEQNGFKKVSRESNTYWELTDTIDKIDNQEHFYDLTIQPVKDLLGRGMEAGKTYHFSIDNLAPRISISWESASEGINQECFPTFRTMVLTVEELNFNNSLIDVEEIYTNYDKVEQPEKRVYPVWNNTTGRLLLDVDGDYSFRVNGKDTVDNVAVEQTVEKFTIDTVEPQLKNMSFDNNNVVNGCYYTSGRTLTITVEERNCDESSFEFNLLGSPWVGYSYKNDGNIHYITYSALSEGDYSMTFEVTDYVGHTLNPAGSVSLFTIDWTKPNIQISGVENRQAYGDSAQPNVTITDANMAAATTCQVESLGATKGHPYNASPATSRTQYTYSYANPERVPENDGVYRINVNAVDMAGNGDVQERVWSVNRFGSTYVIDAETEKIMDGYVNKDSIKDIIVTEINPSGVENHSIDMTKGSFTETLNEGSDYTAAASGGDGTWYECVYTIKKDFFKEDGKYTLNYISKDKAGNENENTMANKNADRNAAVNVQFMYDNTKPTVSFDNLSEGLYAEANHKATANFEDNSKKFSEAKVIINGEENYVSGDDMDKKHNAIDFELKDSGTPYTIEAIAIDKAGNEMDKDVKTVVVTMNPFLLWFYNTPLFVGSLVGAGVIVAGVLFFLYRRGLWIFKK